MSDIYKRVSSRLEIDWYPYHKEILFTQNDVCVHFQWFDPELRQAVSKKLYHDYKERKPPILELNGRGYRVLDTEVEEMDWQHADKTATVDLLLPFDLQQYVKFFPKSVIVIAGVSNAGKTAFLYNFILMNMHKHIITLYNSETSPEQMNDRLSGFDMEIPNPAPFRTIDRYDNFADVIDPDGISVVDYVDNDVEVYNNGLEISRMFHKLRRGVVFAALQKKKLEELGYGGNPTLKRAALYLSMNPNKLKIVKGKSWKDPTVNPNGMMWNFKLINGARFCQIERDYENET